MLDIYSKFILNYSNKKFLSTMINILLYPTDFQFISNNSDIFSSFKLFITNLSNEIKNDKFKIEDSKNSYLVILNLIYKLIDLKEDSNFSFINYDNVIEYFKVSDSYILNIINDILDEKFNDISDFKKNFDYILQEITIFHQIQNIKSTLIKWDNLSFDNTNSLNLIKSFKDIINESNLAINDLNIVKSNKTDYIMFSSDNKHLNTSLDNIYEFLKSSYNSYKSGYELFDTNLSGIESSSVMLISGPSNHAKSIFMMNIVKSMFEFNYTNNSDEVFVFITLEDDIYKLFRRILSIFGNYDVNVIKQLFNVSSNILKNNEYKNILSRNTMLLIDEITKDSMTIVFNSNKKFIIKHCEEGSFSMNDANKLIESLKLQGLTTKALFIDYIDVMIPSIKINNSSDEYYNQGIIMHEMRQTSRKHGIPIITITQNNRSAENFQIEMSNNLMGDSIKKVRYTDSIIMIRQRNDLDLFDSKIVNDLKISNNNIADEYSKYIVPFEVKITKAKDGIKNQSKFHIFNTKNLRIIETFDEFLSNIKICIKKSDNLLSKINILTSNDLDDIIYDEDFTNIII